MLPEVTSLEVGSYDPESRSLLLKRKGGDFDSVATVFLDGQFILSGARWDQTDDGGLILNDLDSTPSIVQIWGFDSKLCNRFLVWPLGSSDGLG